LLLPFFLGVIARRLKHILVWQYNAMLFAVLEQDRRLGSGRISCHHYSEIFDPILK